MVLNTETKEMVKVTESELVSLMMTVNGSTFINLVTETDVRMNKTGNPYFGRVKKMSSRNYLIGNDYEKRVVTNGEKEGVDGFEVGELKGKHHVSKCVLQSDKDESVFYLMVELFDEIPPIVEYSCEGDPIEKQLFEDYMVKVYENKSQPQERKVKVITPKFSSIKRLSMNGVVYVKE